MQPLRRHQVLDALSACATEQQPTDAEQLAENGLNATTAFIRRTCILAFKLNTKQQQHVEDNLGGPKAPQSPQSPQSLSDDQQRMNT